MNKRALNFFPGPCALPFDAIKDVHENCCDFEGKGMSLWETSHRTPDYEKIHNEAQELMHEAFQIPDTHTVLMLGGGGTLQFAMIPLNFLKKDSFAEFVLTGYWSKRGYDDAKMVGDARIIATNEENHYSYVPKGYPISNDSSYLYLTTNNTFYGSELHEYPDTGDVPLFLDMSSDILTRKVDWSKVDLAFAGLTKNLGPGGMAVVIMNKELLEKNNRNIPSYLRYDIHHENNSMFNTPPTFCIYLMRAVLKWTIENGGVEQMDFNASKRADMVYNIIDTYPDYYHCPIAVEDRSRTNICWHMPNEQLERKFVEEAENRDMYGLAGHSMVGHCRASLYNAMPLEGVKTLTDFMVEFMEKNPLISKQISA